MTQSVEASTNVFEELSSERAAFRRSHAGRGFKTSCVEVVAPSTRDAGEFLQAGQREHVKKIHRVVTEQRKHLFDERIHDAVPLMMSLKPARKASGQEYAGQRSKACWVEIVALSFWKAGGPTKIRQNKSRKKIQR